MLFNKVKFFNFLRISGLILLVSTFALTFQILIVSASVVKGPDPYRSLLLPANFTLSPAYPLPYSGMSMNYYLTAQVPESPLPIPTNLTINFSDNSSIPSRYKYDYNYTMKLNFLIGGFYSENFTFYVNNLNRQMVLDSTKTQSTILANYISLIYNNSSGAINYVPFWIIPYNLTLGSQYPIYSFNFTIESTFTADFHGSLGIRKALEARVNNFIVNPSAQANLKNNLSAIYDYQTGILLDGHISSQINWYNGTTKQYELDFNLRSTNAFSKFSNLENTTSSLNLLHLPPTNYILLFISVGLPIIVAIISFLRIRRIDGGL